MPIFVERYLLPVLAALTVIVAVTNPMRWGWQPRVTGGLAVCVTAYLISRLLHRYSARSAGGSGNPLASSRVMIPASVRPSQIMSVFFDGKHTSLEADRATQPYIGKWMTFSGSVEDVSEGQLHFIDAVDQHNVRVFASFDASWRQHLEVIPRGQNVTVVGRVARACRLYFALDHCEIVP
jgi:hypothetical protein